MRTPRHLAGVTWLLATILVVALGITVSLPSIGTVVDAASKGSSSGRHGKHPQPSPTASPTQTPTPQPSPTPPPSTGPSAAYQGNPAHTGFTAGDTLMPTLTRKWTVDLGTDVSYPLFAQGLVFVTAGSGQASAELYALNQGTGATAWGPIDVGGGSPSANATYDAGRVFVLNSLGTMRALDAATGTTLWTVTLPNASLGYTAAPTALNGHVYTDGGQNQVVAVNESDGTLAWSQSLASAGSSSPAVTSDGVYVCFGGDDCWKFDPSIGTALWHHSTGLLGGGGAAPVVAGGLVWGRGGPGFESAPVLDAATGAQVGTWPGYGPPAIDTANGIGVFYTTYGTLEARDLASGQTLWSFAEDGAAGTQAIANGYVYTSTSARTLYVLDEKTGRQVFYDYTFLPQLGGAGQEGGSGAPDSGLTIGQGMLGVPAGTNLIDYVSSGNPPWGPPSFNPIPNQGDQAMSLGINSAHSGGQSSDTLSPPLTQAWTVSFTGLVSYPLIADGKVFVVVGEPFNSGVDGARLYAFDQSNGQTVWGPVEIGGRGNDASLAYDQGRLFTLNGSGWLKAFDARNGMKLWAVPLQATTLVYNSPPTALNGMVYVDIDGAPGALDAIDAATGTIVWTQGISGGRDSSPAVSNGVVYISQCANVAAAFDAVTGTPLWVDGSITACGGGGTTPAQASGTLYTRQAATNNGTTYDVASGNQTGTFSAGVLPAFDGSSHGFFLRDPQQGVLEARDLGTGNVIWTFSGDGQLDSNPVVANGVVYVASVAGGVFALDAATGALLWTGQVASLVYPACDYCAGDPEGAIAVGQGVLVVPSQGNLTVFKGAGAH
ncbi:MAG: PQQ-binding-like beta-propeller repeat protein [Acidimicrobiaceae bacterium]|nr:PQQ-binding-like beta-propeller repeat protein [Acidimicrobiaceae bacterium]